MHLILEIAKGSQAHTLPYAAELESESSKWILIKF